MENLLKYKSAGYTHYISWEIYHPRMNLKLKDGFPTTENMVERHKASLMNKKGVLNLKIEVI